MTWGLAEAAVTETEHVAAVPPPEDSAQLAAGLNVSVGTDELNVTEPVGAIVAPAAVFVTVTVTVEGWPTTTVGLENPMPVEVVSAVTVRLAPPDDA